MAVYVANLNINKGADFNVTYTIEDPTTNSPLSLVGYAASAQLRKTYTSTGVTTFTTSVTDAEGGKITIALSDAQTSALKEGRHVYDVVITSPANYQTRVVEGTVIVRPGVTR